MARAILLANLAPVKSHWLQLLHNLFCVSITAAFIEPKNFCVLKLFPNVKSFITILITVDVLGR